MSHRISTVPVRKHLLKETTKVLDSEAHSSKMEHFIKRIHTEKLTFAGYNQIQKLFLQNAYAGHCFTGCKDILSVIREDQI